MTGGLMNLVAYGNENLLFNGNPKKTFLKQHIKNILILDYKDLE